MPELHAHRKPKVKHSLESRVRRYLNTTMLDLADGSKLTAYEALVKVACDKAIKGNDKVMKILFDVLKKQPGFQVSIQNHITADEHVALLDRLRFSDPVITLNGNGHAANGTLPASH